MATNFSIINNFYNAFSTDVHSGYANILGDVNFLLNILIVVSVVLTAVLIWTSETDGNVIKGVIQRILFIGIFVYITENWQTIVGWVIDSFFDIGAKAGGGSVSNSAQAANMPFKMMQQGYNLANSLVNVMNNYSGFSAVFLHAAAMICYAAAVLLTLGAFIWLTIEIFLAILEYKLVCLAGFIFVPLNVWNGTAAFGGGILRYVLGAGARVLTIALIANISTQILQQVTVSQTLDIENAASVAFSAVIVLLLAIKVPHMAASLVSGSPAFSGAAALGTMGAAAMGAYSGAKAAGSAVTATTTGGMKGAAAAYRMASRIPDRIRGARGASDNKAS